MPFNISLFSNSFSRMKPSPSSLVGKLVRSKKASESVMRADGISHFRPSGVTDENWKRYKERIEKEKYLKNHTKDLYGKTVKAEPNGLRSSEDRIISRDAAMKEMYEEKRQNSSWMKIPQRKPVPSPIKNNSFHTSVERGKQVKSNVNSGQVAHFDRKARDFELQRVMQSIPGSVLTKHPHIADSFNKDRSHYTSSMYGRAIKYYQAFIPEEYDPNADPNRNVRHH